MIQYRSTMTKHLKLAIACGLAAFLAGGCVMAARKGEQRLEERDGPVGHLLGQTRETLRGHPTPTPAQP
jgi:hypothetical protein